MGAPATGRRVVLGLGYEARYGVPGTETQGYDPNLPVNGALQGNEVPRGTVNRSGFAVRGVPGPKGGGFEWGFPLAAELVLPYLYHLVGQVVIDQPEPGVYRYVFAATASPAETSFHGLMGLPPVTVMQMQGVRFGELSFQLGDNVPIPVRLKGSVGHGGRVGRADAQPGNTGAYSLGPQIRGVLADPEAGDVWIEVSRDVAGGGLRFRCEQTPGAPTFAGPETDVLLDLDGLADWQNLQGADGTDLGLWEENKDPLELCWVGDSAALADLDVGDRFRFAAPGTWGAPALPILGGVRLYTSAHCEVRVRAASSPDPWRTVARKDATFTLSAPLEPQRDRPTKYVATMPRTGEWTDTLQVTRAYTDEFFYSSMENRRRLEVATDFLGRQLGTGAFRESILWRRASCVVEAAGAAVSGETILDETVQLRAETDDAANPPTEITVITDLDWSPPA
ncbi:MAG: hypothetical protein AAGN66_08575 [Acidobacteriota bacterium]